MWRNFYFASSAVKDDFKAFMPETNACYGEGTLANFRARYGHTQASFNVEKSYNYGYGLLRFTLHSYVVALAMTHLGFISSNFNTIPEHLKGLEANLVGLRQKLEETVAKIFEFEWRDILKSIRQKR
jgi:hypothetical protein